MTRRVFIAMLLTSIGSSAFACQPRGGTMDADELIRKTRTTLQIGHVTIAPDDFTPARLAEAVSHFDESVRLPGLDQDLDAEQLDFDKVTAFVEFLPCLPGSMLALVSGRTLRLNLPALELHTGSAVTPETMRTGYRLEPDATTANPHLAAVRLIATPSASLARARIARARNAVSKRDAQLRMVTAGPETAETLREAARLRQERRSAVMVWASLADRLLRHDPTDRAAAVEAAAARQALASESVGPSGGGMP